MRCEISYEGFGNIKIGMTREEVRAILDNQFRSFVKSRGSEPVDAFEKDSIFVYYGSDGRCEAVEVASPCKPYYKELDLLNAGFRHVIEHLKKFDPDIIEKEDGFISDKLGIGGYCPNPEENLELESVICFEEGYYDK
jgi:hypothetical protein